MTTIIGLPLASSADPTDNIPVDQTDTLGAVTTRRITGTTLSSIINRPTTFLLSFERAQIVAPGTYDWGAMSAAGSIDDLMWSVASGGTVTATYKIGTTLAGATAIGSMSAISTSGTADANVPATAPHTWAINDHIYLLLSVTSVPEGATLALRGHHT